MSEKPGLVDASELSSGNETNLFSSGSEPSRWGNKFVFLIALILLILASIFVSTFALIPTLIPLPIFVWGMIVLGASISTSLFVLFKRAASAASSREEVTRLSSLIAGLDEKNLNLKNSNRDLKRFYQEERQHALAASNAKTAFLAHLSHNFRTPLTHIIGFADMLTHETFGPIGDKRYISYIKDIKKSGEGLLTSLSDVLDLAELVKGSRDYLNEEISVSDLFLGIKTRFGARAQRCGLTLEIDNYCSAILAGDRVSYERLLECLVDNSLKFTPAGGQIKLAAWEATDGVVLEVTDNGIGIEKTRLKKLMQPFNHDDASISKKHMSLGLGLTIAKSIAELSGGEMAIDSSPTLGTTVVITLPVAAKTKAKQSKVA